MKKIWIILVLVIVGIVGFYLFGAQIVQALSSGPNNGATFANDETVGTVLWSNLRNASSSNDARATAALLVDEQSNYLKATNFSFSIPTGATINGIVVEVEKSSTVLNATADTDVKIVKGGVIGVTDKSAVPNWPTTDAYTTYGGATDLWGETWTAADINGTTFGFVISALGNLVGTARVDHIRITVYYTEAATAIQRQSEFWFFDDDEI